MLFQSPLTQILPQDFVIDSHAKSLQLRLSTGLLSIVEEIQQDKNLIFQVYGEPGSGCSTLVQGICQHLCEINHITKEEILYLSLNGYCNEKSLWDFMSNLAKQKDNKHHATFFSATSVTKDDKIKTFLKLFSFKLVCFDNSNCNENLLNCFLKHLVFSKTTTFIISTRANQIHADGEVRSIEVRGLNLSTAQELLGKLCPSLCHTYKDGQISSLCEILKYNPVAIRLFCALVSSHELDEHVENILKDATTAQQQGNEDSEVNMFALDWMLDHINLYLEVSSIRILHQLCHLRRPLPLTKVKPVFSRLIELNLLMVKKEGSVNFISIDPCIQKHLSSRKNAKTSRETGHFSVLECWLSLVSKELQKLVQDAERNAWPFVEEKWQYDEEGGKEENYNVQDLLTSKNLQVPSLTELEILQECLFHAHIEDNDFEKMAALVLVLDRFLYRQGEAKTSMDIVDHIRRKSPKTAIAPQLVIRKVRLMKDSGDLQGAEKILDRILEDDSKLGEWKYINEQFQLVSGACYQVKGEIQYGLGHWEESASLLIKSIYYFESLLRRDKKGLAYSYGQLCLCLRNMMDTEYTTFAQKVGLFECHPFLAAYFSSQEAAELSSYTPLFFVRHTCRAGEVLFEYLNLIHDKNEKQHLLRIVIEDLRDSIQAHQSYTSLTSREQFYLLVCAVYKISLALFQIGSNHDKEKGTKLKDLSTELYEHYCTSHDRVPINKDVVEVVGKCLSLLELEAFSQETLPKPAEALVNYCKKRKAVRQKENTCLFTVSFFDNLKKLEVTTPHLKKSKNSQEDLRIQVLKKTVADRQKIAVEMSEKHLTKKHLNTRENSSKSQYSKAIDRCADTAEVPEKQVTPQGHSSKLQDGDTVDRCADTAEVPEKQVTPQAHTSKSQDGDTVDQYTDTAEMLEEEQAHHTLSDTLEKLASMTMEGEGIITQPLENEAASLPSQTMDMLIEIEEFSVCLRRAAKKKAVQTQVKDAILWRYDSPTRQWREQPTMVYVGNQLELAKGKEGSQRDVYTVEFVNQDEEKRRYVAKCYRKDKTMQQYQNDILSQMTAKQYVVWFNQQLYEAAAGVPVGDIQFLPVVLLQLVNPNGQNEIFNAEPYMSGEFTKLTNNTDWKNIHRSTDLVLAYSHFTYQASNSKLIIVDIQGWAPLDNKGCTFLTDPQIHSHEYKCFGTGNFGKEGYDNFWRMHSECNEICKMLGLKRPSNKYN